MGGGGLVILKHKSWNVWNKNNIDKVKADEAEHEAKEAAVAKKRAQAEAEIRYETLRGNKLTAEEKEARIQAAIDSAVPYEDVTMESIAKKRTRDLEDQAEQGPVRKKKKREVGHATFFAGALGLPTTVEGEKNLERLMEEKKEEKEINDRYTMYVGQSATKDMEPWYLRSESERTDILALPASQVQRPGMKRFHTKYGDLEDRETKNENRRREMDPMEDMLSMMYGETKKPAKDDGPPRGPPPRIRDFRPRDGQRPRGAPGTAPSRDAHPQSRSRDHRRRRAPSGSRDRHGRRRRRNQTPSRSRSPSSSPDRGYRRRSRRSPSPRDRRSSRSGNAWSRGEHPRERDFSRREREREEQGGGLSRGLGFGQDSGHPSEPKNRLMRDDRRRFSGPPLRGMGIHPERLARRPPPYFDRDHAGRLGDETIAPDALKREAKFSPKRRPKTAPDPATANLNPAAEEVKPEPKKEDSDDGWEEVETAPLAPAIDSSESEPSSESEATKKKNRKKEKKARKKAKRKEKKARKKAKKERKKEQLMEAMQMEAKRREKVAQFQKKMGDFPNYRPDSKKGRERPKEKKSKKKKRKRR